MPPTLRSCHRRLPPTLLLLALSVATCPPAGAADRSGPARQDSEAAERSSAITRVAPRTTSARSITTPPALRLKPTPLFPTAPGERPALMIDAGSASAAPTETERRKLEAARAAVERARLSGTLYRVRAPRAESRPLPLDWESRKRALMRAQSPKPFAEDPTAGVGPSPSIQKSGPAGLSPAEKVKRQTPQPAVKERDPNEGGH